MEFAPDFFNRLPSVLPGFTIGCCKTLLDDPPLAVGGFTFFAWPDKSDAHDLMIRPPQQRWQAR